MARLTIVREFGWAWTKWNAAVYAAEIALERHGLERLGAWTDADSGRVFVGTARECEAVATALEGLGLTLERPAVTVGNA